MTWLDWFVRQRAGLVREKLQAEGPPTPRLGDGGEDALAALAEEVEREIRTGDFGASQSHEIAMFGCCLMPFLRPFGRRRSRQEPAGAGAALGLVLTRDTAQLLSDAEPPAGDAWRQRIFGERPGGDGLGAVYVDVPHGALQIGADLQIRAMLAAPWAAYADGGDESLVGAGAVLVAMVVTARASERPAGVVFAVADADDGVLAVGRPDNTLIGFLHTDPTAGDGPSSTGAEELYALVLDRGVRFLRLVLAFHRYGPAEARDAISATPAAAAAKNRNRPRRGESLFALVQLRAPANRLGRPPCPGAAAGGWSLTTRQDVSGHFKLQPHGPGGSLRRLIWVDAYTRGAEDAPLKPRAVRL